ncbi:hypothetical protein [Oceanobacillus rekensis]|uniref:hypothetical protein n=1 Tax=Oceanobacillus rekensis TaxID=937927 RepID=UPI000B43D0BC|nr:hypothetical protein [Oceanobacillus rekensis]
MSTYLFVAAAVIAVIGIMIVFKINMDKIKENPEQLENAQQKFFIGVAMSESIPILLVIFALINAEPVPVEDLYLPMAIVILMMVFAAFFIFLQRNVDVEKAQKQQVNTFSMIALMLANAIPIIALVMMFINVA